MSDTIKRAILQKFHQFFALRFYNALRMFCDIKLWAFDTAAFIAIGYCIRTHCDKYIYVRGKYSISCSDLAWLNRSATRTRWCILVKALPVQRVPMLFPVECAPTRDAKLWMHLRALKADVFWKINYLLVRATLRFATFANESAPDVCHSGTRVGHVTCLAMQISNRSDHSVDLRTFSEFEDASRFV